MYLETPKGFVSGRSFDARNLATLRRLFGRQSRGKSRVDR
jgi:hypothetical protein